MHAVQYQSHRGRLPGDHVNSETMGIRHTDADDIELKASLQQLFLNLIRDAIKTNMAVGIHSRSSHCFGGRVEAD